MRRNSRRKIRARKIPHNNPRSIHLNLRKENSSALIDSNHQSENPLKTNLSPNLKDHPSSKPQNPTPSKPTQNPSHSLQSVCTPTAHKMKRTTTSPATPTRTTTTSSSSASAGDWRRRPTRSQNSTASSMPSVTSAERRAEGSKNCETWRRC